MRRCVAALHAACRYRGGSVWRHCTTGAVCRTVSVPRWRLGGLRARTVAAGSECNLVGLTREAMVPRLGEAGVPVGAVDTIAADVHRRGVTRLEDLSVAKRHREALATAGFVIDTGTVVTRQDSEDGTVKWLLRVADNIDVETVFIPEDGRGTLCVSSQGGCSLACKFCFTGTQPLRRNLTSGEIVSQLITARRELDCFPVAANGDDLISNIVFMGQGEPLYNFRNVSSAVQQMTDKRMGHIAPKRLCISTSGIAPNMVKVGSELGVNLALSLHAVNDKIRSAIMPINDTYSLDSVLDACRQYLRTGRRRRVMFEYVLLDGVNSSTQDAQALVDLIADMKCHVNLIPFNPFPGSSLRCPQQDAMDAFAQVVLRGGIPCALRTPRGRDIMAACGQLNTTA